MSTTDIQHCYIDSPIGRLCLRASNGSLIALEHNNQSGSSKFALHSKENTNNTILKSAKKELQEYFDGKREHFTVPLSPQGTDFQRLVWDALLKIPYGETWSYQDLAEHIGNPRAVRAVGLANSKNPISIFIPCHRVIGKNGKLTGYAGGLEQKSTLLSIENSYCLL